MVMINNNMNKEKGSFGEVEHIFHCPDARERAGPVFPPPPHSPTNFEWRVCLGKSCRYVYFNKNMPSRATSKSCFMALTLKLSHFAHLLERGQISLTGIWNVSRYSAITF